MPKQALAVEYEPETLTEREMEVLVGIEAGHTNKEIAQQLGIKCRTVEKYCEYILVKLGVSNRTRAAKVARDLGLVP